MNLKDMHTMHVLLRRHQYCILCSLCDQLHANMHNMLVVLILFTSKQFTCIKMLEPSLFTMSSSPLTRIRGDSFLSHTDALSLSFSQHFADVVHLSVSSFWCMFSRCFIKDGSDQNWYRQGHNVDAVVSWWNESNWVSWGWKLEKVVGLRRNWTV